jgi:hypothetical protein
MGNLSNSSQSNLSWTTEGPNILSEETLERVRQAISEGWICGLHLYLGGDPPDPLAFGTYDPFHTYVVNSKPGDCFILWSVAEMRKKGLLLVDTHFRDIEPMRDSLLSEEDINHVLAYLTEAEFNEILCLTSVGKGEPEVFWADFDSSRWNSFLESAQRAAVCDGSLCILPFTKIDTFEYYLVKAKRPNSEGQVPLGGAY